MSQEVVSFYRQKHSEYSDKLRKVRHKQRLIMFARLGLFMLMVILPLAFAGDYPLAAAILFVVFLSMFLFLVKVSDSVENTHKYVSSLLDINLKEIEAERGNFSSFDDGSEYADPEHRYSMDIDIFGKNSVFQYINRCVTSNGKDYLSEMLLVAPVDQSIVKRRQKAFSELSGNPGFCQHFIATGSIYKDNPEDRTHILKFINSPSNFTRNRGLAVVARLLPLITLGSLALVIAGVLPLPVFVSLFVIQLLITGALLKRINELHEMVTKRLNSIRKYGKLLQIIQDASFDAPLLKYLQRKLKNEGMPPSAHIAGLSRITEAFDNRLNILVALFLNGLLLWDINCVLLLESWNRRHRKCLPVWFDCIAQADAYISFAVFSFNNPEFIFPQAMTEGPVMNAVGLGHPLIPEKKRVCNDLVIDDTGRFIIITGANMAGKSTFLRTAGVTLVLAMAGAPVCAKEFGFRVMELWSSMRTNDSLSRNESYFFAELKRLRHLIERMAEGAEVFVLLDEMLKGTNTTDKQKGSIALLERMLSLGATGIVATHDLSLTTLEQDFPGKVENKCFEAEIEGDSVSFDYLLKDGVTSKMNALILMRQMGLLPEK